MSNNDGKNDVGSKRDQQEGRVKNAVLPTTAHTTPDSAGPGAKETRAQNDDAWKQNFPQAAAANAGRDAYQQTADAARIQAERAANLEARREATVNDDPVPTGESANPHENEQEVPKHEGEPSEPADAETEEAARLRAAQNPDQQ